MSAPHHSPHRDDAMENLLRSIDYPRLGDGMRSDASDETDDILTLTADFLKGSFDDRCDQLLGSRAER